jgi:lysophospholipase L1-like esterase
MKSLFRKPLIILVQILVVLVMVEVAARVLFPKFTDDKVFMDRAFSRLLNSGVRFNPKRDNYSRKFGFTLSADSETTESTGEYTYTSKTNSLGFRSREIQPATEGEYRVLLLGDSMFYGVGVQESEMVSAVLEEQGSPDLSVYNYSVSGYNTVQEMIVAKNYAESLQPDHIILGFFIANDVIPNAIAYVDAEGNYSTSAKMAKTLRNKLKDSLGVLYYSTALRIVAHRIYIPRLRYLVASSDEVISRSYALLSEFDRFADEHNAGFSVVILYPRDSVQGGMMRLWSNSRETGELIHSFCSQNSIEVLDLINYMNTAEHKERYFFKQDGHPNAEGNALIAEAIYKDLVEPRSVR